MASYDGTAELEALLNTSSLGADLAAFFESPQKVHLSPVEPQRAKFDLSVPDFVPSCAVGLKSGRKLNFFREAAVGLLISPQSDPIGLLRSFSGRSLSVLSNALSSIAATATKPTEPWSRMCVVADTSHSRSSRRWLIHCSRFNTIGPTRCSTECTVPCSTSNGSLTDANPTLCGSIPSDLFNFALLTGVATGVPTVDQIQNQIKANTLPIFRAPIDSGCTASWTDNLARLVNVRPCDDDFKAANGSMCKCTAIGDMPVLAKDSTG